MNRLARVLGLALWLGAGLARAEPGVEGAAAQPPPGVEPWFFDSPFGREVAADGRVRLPWSRGREVWSSPDGRYVAFFVPGQPAPAADDVEARTLVIKSVDADAVVFQKVLYTDPVKPRGPRDPGPPSLHFEDPDRGESSLYATGFPAVSVDGTLVAMVEGSLEGRPWASNLRVMVRRAETNEVVWSDVARSPEAGAVLQRVNECLGQTQWLALRERPVTPVVAGPCKQAPKQQVRWGGQQPLSHDGQLRWKGSAETLWTWQGVDARSRRFIDTAYAEDSTGVVLLRFVPCGDTHCPETFGGHHVIKRR